MSIIQNKRKAISLIVVAIFLVVSIGLNTVNASALSYFVPFNEIHDYSELAKVTVNSQADPELGRFYGSDGVQYIEFGKIQKINMPTDGTIYVNGYFSHSNPPYGFCGITLLDDNDIDSVITYTDTDSDHDGHIEKYVKKGTYYLAVSFTLSEDEYKQEILDGTSSSCTISIASYYSVKTPGLTSINYAKSNKKKTATLKWGKSDHATRYQVRIAQNKSFTKAKKTATTAKRSITFTNLKSKKTYYAQVRGYVTANGKTYYGAYSPIKTVKIK